MSNSALDAGRFERPGVVDRLAGLGPVLVTTWAVIVRPRSFLRAYHESVTRPAATDASPRLRPFEFLGLALFWAALYAGLADTALRPGSGTEATIHAIAGPGARILNLKQLTGIGPIDEVVGDLAKYLGFALFAGLFWLFSLGRLPLRWMAGSFAYVAGAFTILTMLARLAGDLSSTMVGAGEDAAVAFSGALLLANVLYVVVSPVAVWPEILGVTRRRLVLISVAAILAWVVLHAVIRVAFLQSGIVLVGFGLGA